jgi:hypothetical protein
MFDRQLETIWCDDIRFELGGKVSYIGVYTGYLYVPAFPVVLPKLCLAVKIVSRPEHPLQSFELRVLKNGEPWHSATIAKEQLAPAYQRTEKADHKGLSPATTFGVNAAFSPFAIEGPTALRVRGITEGEELIGLGLVIAATPDPAASSPG